MSFTWTQALEALAELRLSHEDVMVAGSAPLLAHGLVDVVGDLDLVLAPAAFARLTATADVVRGRHGDLTGPVSDGIEAFDGWFGEPASAVWARGTTVDGVRVASLSDTLTWKERLGRPKDLHHIELLRHHLSAP